MRNTFNFNLPSSVSRLRFYKLKLTENGPVSSIRARLFANPQFRTSRFRFVLTPISDFGTKSFYTNFSYKYFLSKWKKFEHKKVIANFLRPNEDNFSNVTYFPRSVIIDYRKPVKHKSFIYRRKEYKVFTTRSRFIKKAYFKQYFRNPDFRPFHTYKNRYIKKLWDNFILKSKRALSKSGVEFSPKSIEYFPFFARRKLRLSSFFPSLLRFRFKNRYGRRNKRYQKIIKKWAKRCRSLQKGLSKKKLFLPRFFLRIPAFRLLTELNSFPNFKKIKYFSKIRLKKAVAHAKSSLLVSVLRTIKPGRRSPKPNFKLKLKLKRRKNKFKIFKKLFKAKMKKSQVSSSSVSRRWVWKLRNWLKFSRKDKITLLYKFILDRHFFNHFTKKPKFGESKFLKRKTVDVSKLTLNNKFFYFLRLLPKLRSNSTVLQKFFRPKSYQFKKKFYYSQFYRRRILVKYFRFSFYFSLFSKIWSLRRNTKVYSSFIKNLFLILSKMSIQGKFVYLAPFLINKNHFFGIISLTNSDFYSREHFTTSELSSVKKSKPPVYHLKHKI